jgi:AMP nucleosidase
MMPDREQPLPQDFRCAIFLYQHATVPVKRRCRQDEACKSEHRKLIVTEAFIVVQTAEQAVDRLALCMSVPPPR